MSPPASSSVLGGFDRRAITRARCRRTKSPAIFYGDVGHEAVCAPRFHGLTLAGLADTAPEEALLCEAIQQLTLGQFRGRDEARDWRASRLLHVIT
jgi:hypothetical protein